MRTGGVDRWAAAVGHLRAADPRWGPVIERVGPCGLRPRPDRFGTLVRAIIGQQISTKAAAAIEARLLAHVGDPHDPSALLAAGETGLRSAGISGGKARSILDLAAALGDGRIPDLRRIGRLDDEAIVDRLTSVWGIGRWTAEMFLIFSLNRPDVLPVGDLGVRVGLRDHFGLAEVPAPGDCFALAEPWRPYRSAASWYLWRNLEAGRSRSTPKRP